MRPEYWTIDPWSVISKRPSREIGMPASHDAGMSILRKVRIFAGEGSTQTQEPFIEKMASERCQIF